MGWKASCIFVKSPEFADDSKVLHSLGIDKVDAIGTETFDNSIYPKPRYIYIGTYNNTHIICYEGIPSECYSIPKQLTEFEKGLTSIYTDAEIFIFSLHSVVNHYAFALIDCSMKVRAKCGDADNPLIIDYGDPLEEEKELLARAKVDSKGQRLFYFDDFPNEPFTEDQVGENFIFSISARYLGDSLDAYNQELFEEEIMRGYKIKKANIFSSIFKRL
ncbi:MAG: hypothetical protein ACFB15_21325 [Cyclobacteriaceae bacterium]